MKEKIIVLHEYGAPSHYNALDFSCKRRNVEIEYFEFRPIYHIIKSIYKIDFSLLKRSLRNVIFLITALLGFQKNIKYVVGMAPYDWRVVLIYLIVRKEKYYLHTSWPFWRGGFQPHKSHSIFHLLWRKLINESQAIFCVTEGVKKGIIAQYPYINKYKLHVVYHALDQDFLNSAKSFRKKAMSNGEIKKAIFIGRMDASKGFDVLLDLAPRLKDMNIRLSVVGDGDLKFDTKINDLNYLGFIKDRAKLASLISENDIIILPSRKTKDWQELFGMVIIEALACGVYPVVTDHLGPNELVSITTGKLISEDDIFAEIEGFCEAFSNGYISFNSDELIKYGELFSVEEISKKWESIFNAS